MKMKGLHPEDLPLLPDGGGWLLVEFGGETKEDADAQAHTLMAALKKGKQAPSMKLFDDKKHEKMVWEIRESGLGATANIPGSPLTWEGWEDAAVPPAKVGGYLRDFRKLLDRYGYKCDLYGHFGQGCVHTRIDFDLQTHDGVKAYRAFVHDAADLVVSYGGSLSGEHGDGQSRAELLPKMFGSELIQAFREFKSIWDPDWKMNPGKVVDAYRVDDNLRLGVRYDPWIPETHFKFPDDHGSFASAALRCVGIGNCRRKKAASCVQATWSPETRCMPLADEADFFSRCCREKSSRVAGGINMSVRLWISAWHAKDAKVSVRLTWTWPRTKLSFFPITIIGGFVPFTPMPLG